MHVLRISLFDGEEGLLNQKELKM